MPQRFTVITSFRLLRTPRMTMVFDDGGGDKAGLPVFEEYLQGSDYPLNAMNDAGVRAAVAANLATIYQAT